MSNNARTAADFLWWMKEHGFGFRSGFSHLVFEDVIQMYLDYVHKRDEACQGEENDHDQNPTDD